MIAAPPLLAGAVNVTVACVSPAVAVPMVGTPGAVADELSTHCACSVRFATGFGAYVAPGAKAVPPPVATVFQPVNVKPSRTSVPWLAITTEIVLVCAAGGDPPVLPLPA